MNTRFLKAGFSLALLMTVGGFSMGCDTDPGICFTQGQFPKSQVNKDYVLQNCMDWVYLLIDNCVEVDGLSLIPAERDVVAYCLDNIAGENWGGDEYPKPNDEDGGDDYYNYVIGHTCNFVENPNEALCGGTSARKGVVAKDPVFAEIFANHTKAAPKGSFTFQ